MIHFFNKLFNVRTQEWSRLLLLFFMLTLFVMGWVWGSITIEASFLQQVGVQFLPLIFVVNALLSIIVIAAYTAFADRIHNRTLLIGILVASAAAVGAGAALLEMGLIWLAFPLLYLLFSIVIEIFGVHWWTYVNDFYDTRAAKRVIPILASASRIASIVAGPSIVFLNRRFTPTGIILLWLATLLIVAALAWSMPYLFRKEEGDGRQTTLFRPASQSQQASYRQNMREGYQYIKQSSFLRWMAVSTFLMVLLLTFVNFQTSKILVDELGSAERIANLLGLLDGAANLILLPVQLFLLSRIIGRTGLGNANVIYPLSVAPIFAAVASLPGLGTAAAAYLARTTFRTTFRNTTDSLLYNAVPLRIKGRARAFIGGLVMPIGTLVGGSLLLLPFIRTSWLLPALVIVLALLYAGVSLIIRRQYNQALLTMLEEEEDFSTFFVQNVGELTATDPATLQKLKSKLKESDSPEITIFLANLLVQIGGQEALPVLDEIAAKTDDARMRAAILDVLAASDIRGTAAQQIFLRYVEDESRLTRQAALAGLEQTSEQGDAEFRRVAAMMTQDASLDVQALALAALARRGVFYESATAVQILDQLLADERADYRAQAARILGQLADAPALEKLTRFLGDPADEVRLEAALAVETIARQKPSASAKALMIASLYPLLHDPVERVRQTAVVVLGQIAGRDAAEQLVRALLDDSPAVRETAVTTLAGMGKAIIPLIHPSLNDPDRQLGKMVTVVLARIHAKGFGEMINAHIMNNLTAIYGNHVAVEAIAACAHFPSIAILQSALQDRNNQLLEEVFFLLTALRDPNSLQLIVNSLHSEEARARANAIEALETITLPKITQLIEPFFDPGASSEKIIELASKTWSIEQPDTVAYMRDLLDQADTDPWLAAMMTFALGEIGAADGRNAACPASLLPSSEIETLLTQAERSPHPEVSQAAQAGKRVMSEANQVRSPQSDQKTTLSIIEKIILLKEVPFFEGMTIDQLKILANVCEEEFYPDNTHIFSQKDPGGALYVIVSGRVGIEQEKRRGYFARLVTLGARSYFGEMELFDNNPRSASAITLQDTFVLSLRREPLIALARQYPNLSLELINVLSRRLRQSNDRIAELTQVRSRKLNKLFDEFEQDSS